MSRQDQRGLWSLWMTVLALGLIGQFAEPAVAWQGPPQARQPISRDLKPLWRIDFQKGEPSPSDLVREIPISNRLHPKLGVPR